MIGQTLGHYEIVEKLGEGGMGEVYRARDPRLGREVAIKTLPAAFSADPDRLGRFDQEARAAAALNHPNILAVHDTGIHDGAPFVVSELLQGSTLRERLRSGTGSAAALPVRKAIDYAIQIANGLSAAHDKHIVHRDLKPENLFVTTDGRVKILDFGLAKLTEKDAASPSDSTVAGFQSEPGMVLGTVGYMAPEQVRGQPVDHRADIFAFGVVLYEMLAGRRAFHGTTAADTIAAIVKDDPPDLPVAERHIAPALARIVDRCLEKAPAARFQTASDLAFALESLSLSSDHTDMIALPPAPSRRSRERVTIAVAALFGLGLLATGITTVRHLGEAPPPVEPVRFIVPPPEDGTLVPPAVVSPDGRHLVFRAIVEGTQALWLRPLAGVTATLLAGTTGASFPFWSPDGRSIGFFANGSIYTVAIAGGQPAIVTAAAAGGGATWGPDGTIVFAPAAYGALWKVPASGGQPVQVTTLADDEAGHRWPTFLPDGRSFLYVAFVGSGPTSGDVWIGSLDRAERTLVGPANSHAEYASGYVLFARGGTLVGRPFDATRGIVTGDDNATATIAQGLAVGAGTLRGGFSVSGTGVLAYRTSRPFTISRLTWFDRSGKALGTVGDPGSYYNLALRPDDGRLAVSRVLGGPPPTVNIWLLDTIRNTAPVPLTSHPAWEFDPFWSFPDGAEVLFTSNRDKTYDVYRRAADGRGEDTLLLKVPGSGGANGAEWSPDGRFLAYTSGGNVWVMPTEGDRQPRLFIESPFDESEVAFSPDGRWLAYSSNESGRVEVHVQAFPDGGRRSVVSRDGGQDARWRADGRELYFLALDGTIMAASIEATTEFRATDVRPLFRTDLIPGNNRPYAVTRDGQRFILPVPVEARNPESTTVVLNWASDVER